MSDETLPAQGQSSAQVRPDVETASLDKAEWKMLLKQHDDIWRDKKRPLTERIAVCRRLQERMSELLGSSDASLQTEARDSTAVFNLKSSKEWYEYLSRLEVTDLGILCTWIASNCRKQSATSTLRP